MCGVPCRCDPDREYEDHMEVARAERLTGGGKRSEVCDSELEDIIRWVRRAMMVCV